MNPPSSGRARKAHGPASAAAPASGAIRPEREKLLVLLLCLLAGIRVFVFSAAFPLFNNVDELAHADLVSKYSRGHLPDSLEMFDLDVARTNVLYGSVEFMSPPDKFPGGVIPPPGWSLPPEPIREAVDKLVARWTSTRNHECGQPPLYYAAAGLWYRTGELLGLREGRAIYWIRFLNVLLVGLLPWLAHAFARSFAPEDGFLRVGMPLLVAFLPQDMFYAINNDVLVPLAGGLAVFRLLLLAQDRPRSAAWHAVTGLLVAAALLVKLSNIAILALLAAVLVLRLARAPDRAARRAALARGGVLLAAAAAPLLAWGLRNQLLLGDATGSAGKETWLGWTRKPLGAVFDHPIFTPAGLWTFWHGNLATFWRGEFVWGLKALAHPGWDLFYSLSSALLVGTALAASVTWAKQLPRERRTVGWLSGGLFLLSLAFLGAISIAYDFGACYYPSRAHPFLTSGRLLLGALVPFAALYLGGVEALLPGRRRAAVRWALLIGVVALMTISEVWLSRGAFASRFNWFHLR